MGKLKLAVFFSGGGSTLQNLIDHIRNGTLDADINWTLSSRAGVDGIRKSEEAGIPCLVVPRKEFDSHKSFSEKINEHLRDNPVDLIVLAGFMSLYHFPPEYNRRVVNIHPALIPAFCGLGMYGHHVHEAVIQSGVRLTGATVHFADNEYDRGPIIIQETVPVLDEDTPDTVAERVQELERKIYPQAIQLIAEDRIRVEGNRVKIRVP
ncbi:MAG: phosphoribosylglycinamide formyltransferase [Candidatus Omnitrophica bacterium]|nr:phosphoribosylglycinamide formyltransferase [Candidatus Omnitrophota bacterium]MCB9783317.1 phosphoribosylglycinamide formyltransferase [Candidatus Omnitrophota bacterium]